MTLASGDKYVGKFIENKEELKNIYIDYKKLMIKRGVICITIQDVKD